MERRTVLQAGAVALVAGALGTKERKDNEKATKKVEPVEKLRGKKK